MPYMIVERDDEHCVYKRGPDGEPEGDTLGCHETRADAAEQIAAIEAAEAARAEAVSVKALPAPAGGDGDWELEVLGVPYGGPFGGKDAQGEYFSPRTRLHDDKFPLPPVVYYHGLDPSGRPAGEPAYIGRAVSYEDRPDGRWYRVVLDRASELARRVWEAARRGLARASSGSIAHLVRRAADGHILEWPVAELSVFDMGDGRRPANSYAIALPVAKARWGLAGLVIPDDISDATEASAGGAGAHSADAGAEEVYQNNAFMEGMMSEETKITMDDVAAAAAKAAEEALAAAEAERQRREAEQAAMKEQIEQAIAEARQQWEAEAAKAGRLPFDGTAPAVTHYARDRRYDHMDAGTHAMVAAVLGSAAAKGAAPRPSDAIYASLAAKLLDDRSDVGAVAAPALKAAGITSAAKADEVNYSTLSGYGDEWVGIAYSQAIWEAIRNETPIADLLPAVEVPPGAESMVVPIEGADPTFYRVGQVTSDEATGGLSTPLPTVPSSRLATSRATLSLVKMGARIRWSGELSEDSIVPWAEQLRRQLVLAGAQQFEHVIIDGDTATGATTNINDIGGTPAGTEAFLLVDGFRKLALVTNTANSYSVGTLTAASFKEVLKLMGAAGAGAADPTRVVFILDPNVYWKALELTEVKTRDVIASPTIESGMLTALWGYRVIRSYSMHWVTRSLTGYEYKANAAGQCDLDVASNNTTGAFLAVDPRGWLLGYRRRMTMETVRHPEWDGYEIVAMMRFGLVNRDTEAAAIGYNVTLS